MVSDSYLLILILFKQMSQQFWMLWAQILNCTDEHIIFNFQYEF